MGVNLQIVPITIPSKQADRNKMSAERMLICEM